MSLITRAEKKVQIAIDKMIDLKEDFVSSDTGLYDDISRLLDRLNELENRISSSKVKDGQLYAS